MRGAYDQQPDWRSWEEIHVYDMNEIKKVADAVIRDYNEKEVIMGVNRPANGTLNAWLMAGRITTSPLGEFVLSTLTTNVSGLAEQF
jgi:hypothetical protein